MNGFRQIKKYYRCGKELKESKKLDKESLTKYKQMGLSDKRIGH
jgi:uncharacterized protein YutE (UPF0331/DUF86 family)